MVEITGKSLRKLFPFFEGATETMIWSCLQEHMGRAWADNAESPHSVRLIVSCFCFFAGEPDEELVSLIPDGTVELLVADPSPEWAELIERIYPGENRRSFPRYAIRKDTSFDRSKLERYRAALPEGYSLKRIDKNLCETLLQEIWSYDFCANFLSPADFLTRGIGYVALYNDIPVAGASSFSVYDGGIEIEIDTREDHRRKGLALVCASALILACLDSGLYPSWDAATMISVQLAEKLGYCFDHEYTTYWIRTGKECKNADSSGNPPFGNCTAAPSEVCPY